MDKYEYKLRTEQMLEFMDEGEFAKAAEIADTIDWRRVRNVSMLATVGDIYEKIGNYSKSYEVLKIVYDRSDGSRKIVYRLGLLALRLRNIDEAVEYYDEFSQVAPKDPNRYILKYKILRAKKAPVEQQIEALEEFKKAEYIEKWAYELAKLYQEAGMTAECLEECDDLILWFSEGEYVYKAMELKMQYKPLTPSQLEKYNHRDEQLEEAHYMDLEGEVEEELEEETEVPEEAAEEELEAEEEAEETAEEDREEEKPEEKPLRTSGTIGTNMPLADAIQAIVNKNKQQEKILKAETIRIPDVDELLKEVEAEEELSEQYEEEDSDQIKGQMSLEDILADWNKPEQPKETPEEAKEEVKEEVKEEPKAERKAGRKSVGVHQLMHEINLAELEAEEILEEEPEESIAEPEEILAEVDIDEEAEEEEYEEEEYDEEAEEEEYEEEEYEEEEYDEEAEEEEYDEEADEEEYEEEEYDEEADEEEYEEEEYDEEEYDEEADEEEYDEEEYDEDEEYDDEEEYEEEEYDEEADEEEYDEEEYDDEFDEDEEFDEEEYDDEFDEDEEYDEEEYDDELDEDEEFDEYDEIDEELEEFPEDVSDDREIEDDDDDFPDLLASTTPLSRKETAKMIATGKTAPLPLDEISNALSMNDTGFIVHGRYDLETQSGVGTRAGLTEEQKKLFSYFVPVRGMSEQLVDVLEQDKNCTNRHGTSRTGNLLIIGRKGSGKTVLAVDVVKAIQKQRNIHQGKVAIVTGDSLNKKKIGDIVAKLYGGALIIEKAGKMNERTVAKLNKAMEGDTGEMLIVLEEQRKPLDRLLSSNREFRRKFTSRLEVPIFINDELVTFGQTYARENGYRIDEMGILALYSRIDALQREDHAVTVSEVKDVLDEAITHSQKASAKRLVKRVFGRGTDEADRIILSEKDFNI